MVFDVWLRRDSLQYHASWPRALVMQLSPLFSPLWAPPCAPWGSYRGVPLLPRSKIIIRQALMALCCNVLWLRQVQDPMVLSSQVSQSGVCLLESHVPPGTWELPNSALSPARASVGPRCGTEDPDSHLDHSLGQYG